MVLKMKKIFTCFLFLALCLQAGAVTKEHSTTKFQGLEREYYISVPDSLAEGKPLIIFLHGYGSRAKGQRPELESAALSRGYAICYPQGVADPKGKNSWNVGYPSQEGMKTDDVAFMLHLSKHLCKKYGLGRDNVFLGGSSNGGEMCYIMAYSHPKAFAAIASMAGLQMGWTLEKLHPKGSVPFMEVHATADKTSRWEGDPTNQYGWGVYLGVPAAVSNIVSMNKCIRYGKKLCEPCFEGGPQYIEHLYDLGTGGTEVVFYEVIGSSHRTAFKDVNAQDKMLDFFSRHIR